MANRSSRKIKSIVICSSASFYREAWVIKTRLEKSGYNVRVPLTAEKMNRTKNYRVSDYKIWHKDHKKFGRKTFLMKLHFAEIAKADAILVVNLKKHGVIGYIGGNVLMEMALAFYLQKPIYVWQNITKTHPFYEEVIGLRSIFLKEDLTNTG